MRSSSWLIGTAAAVLATSVVVTSPASATGYSGKLNMWQHDAYKGQLEARTGDDVNLHNDSCPGCDPGPGGNFGDDMSSYVNNTDRWWFFYTDRSDASGSGDQLYCVRPRSKDGNLGNNGWSNLEDEISSVIKGPTGKFGDANPNVNITCKRYVGHRI